MWSQSQIYKTRNIGRSPASYPISFSLLPAPSLTSGYFLKNMISSFTYCYQHGCVYTYMYPFLRKLYSTYPSLFELNDVFWRLPHDNMRRVSSFLFIAAYCAIVWMCRSLFTKSSVDRHLGYGKFFFFKLKMITATA